MRVFAAKMKAHREQLVSFLQFEEPELSELQKTVSSYQKELPLYIEELREELDDEQLAAALQEEMAFAKQVSAVMETLQNQAKDGLLQVNKGKKARKHY